MSVTFCVNHQHADRCTVVSWNTNSKEGASGLPQLKFMEESSRLRPPIKGLQGVGISASQRLPIESKSYWSREWKQIHEPEGRTRDTSKRSHSTDPLPWGPVWHGVSTHTHHETQVPLPLSLLLPPPFLSPPNTWVPLLFYCLSTPLKLNVRPCYWALYISGHCCASYGEFLSK